MMSHRFYVFYLLCLSFVLGACGNQKELIRIMSKTQSELSECRVELSQANQKEVQLEEAQTELKSLLDEREDKLKVALEQVENSRKENVIVTDLNQRQLSLLAKSVGAEVSLRDKVRIVAKFGDLKSYFVYSPKNHVLMAHARFSGFSYELKALNEWNRTRRFSRVYLDKDTDIVLEAEIDLEPGIRPQVLQSWIKNFGLVLNLFHYTLRQGSLRENPKESRRDAERERI